MRAKPIVVTLSAALPAIALLLIACSSDSSGPTAPPAPDTAVNSQLTSGGGPGPNDVVIGPAIDVEKSTNGFDADSPPGPSIPIGDPVEWTYVATNVGDVTLVEVVIDDDQLGEICRQKDVAPGASFICTAGPEPAIDGQYVNEARATASDGDSQVLDTDSSHYLGGGGAFVAVEIEKSTNGADADFEPGVIVNVGDNVEWEYVVTNLGDVTLIDWVVDDDQLGEICSGQDLLPGNSTSCSAGPISATPGQYANLALVTASDGSLEVTDEDMSHYFGSDPAISIDKLTDGQDGPELFVGCTVEWTYELENQGNIELESIAVADDQGVVVSCPQDSLVPGESMTCTGSGVVIEGTYDNVGTVTATAPVDNELEETDDSSYVGVVQPPTCDDAVAEPDILWPPNHRLESIAITGVTDACGASTAITVDTIFQDEPLDAEGDGNTEPDGFGVGTATPQVRAERAGTLNGRVYQIGFTATDAQGQTCTGTVEVGVPHDRHDIPIDDGPNYDSTGGA